MKLKHIPATDASVDPEWLVLNDDDTQTSISIQDCRSYGGGFAINRHTPEGTPDDDFWMEDLGSAKSLKAAFEIACKKALN